MSTGPGACMQYRSSVRDDPSNRPVSGSESDYYKNCCDHVYAHSVKQITLLCIIDSKDLPECLNLMYYGLVYYSVEYNEGIMPRIIVYWWSNNSME